MAKSKTLFVCTQCGYSTPKWMGKCPECGAWNTLSEQAPTPKAQQRPTAVPSKAVRLNEVALDRGGDVRVRTGIGELDGVLGGGLVAGSLVLLGGDPGIGKSTLLLSALDGFSRRGIDVLYASGEESAQQVRLRAQRLGIDGENLWLTAETDFARIEAAVVE
ncbi:MAG: ATPase domain-containing protein, partial [Myxococcota bacterium]